MCSEVASTDAINTTIGQASSILKFQPNLWIVGYEFGKISYICLWADCQEQLNDSDELKAHLDQHLLEYGPEPLTEIVCQVRGCRIVVSSLDELARHVKMHLFHADRMLAGSVMVRGRCPQVASCNFARSSRLVYQGDPLLCEWNSCLQSFTDINQFIGHVELHVQLLSAGDRSGGDALYECLWNECQVAPFGNKAHLLRHIHHHSGDKMCACPFCGAFFANASGLIKHVLRRQQSVGSLLCHFCQKSFSNDALLRKHCVRHLKTYQCSFCSLVVTSPYDLNRHIQTVHAKMRCHCCEYCDRTFYQRSDLNKHIDLHFNDSMYECEQCDKKFRWPKQLREHKRQHQKDFNPTPYECHLCSFRYARGSALSKHLKTVHQMSIPIGFSRFQYKKCQDGFFRLQTKCYVRGNLTANEKGQSQRG